MAKKSKKKIKSKTKAIFLTIFCIVINAIIIYYVANIFTQVYEKKVEKNNLVKELNELKSTGEELKVEVNKLQNSDYVAKYAREKYLYSADGEYILRVK